MDSPAYQGTILAALMPLEALFRNVKIVLTDGAPYFPDVIHELCPQAVHQLCLIHIMRNLFKFLQPFEQQYCQGRRQIAKARESFNLKQETHDFRADKLKKLHQQIRYWESQRSTLQQQYGVQFSVKGILQQYPKLKHANTKLNEIRTKARSMTKHTKEARKLFKICKKRSKMQGIANIGFGGDTWISFKYFIGSMISSCYRKNSTQGRGYISWICFKNGGLNRWQKS